jgi:hypothetical protein
MGRAKAHGSASCARAAAWQRALGRPFKHRAKKTRRESGVVVGSCAAFDTVLSTMATYFQIGVRVDEAFLRRLDAWCRQQIDMPARPEALRRLAERALASTPKPRRRGPHAGAAKATEMAAKEIDRLGDTAATEEQRQSRKRRILKGPAEFRELRKDSPPRKKD